MDDLISRQAAINGIIQKVRNKLADIELVIKIPESRYRLLQTQARTNLGREKLDEFAEAVLNGIPLPKGHGRLIDGSDLMPDSDYEDGIFYAVSIGQINGTPTILEADKESEG